MVVLFDHGTPNGLIRALPGHTVHTAQAKGWDTLSNGAVLEAAEEAGFELLLTTDRRIRYQQNLRRAPHGLGHKSWIDLRRALDDGKGRGAATPDADQYDTVARDILAAYQTGDAAAMQRLQERFRKPVTRETLRAEVDRQLEQLPDAVRPSAGLSLAEIRHFIARSAGFES